MHQISPHTGAGNGGGEVGQVEQVVGVGVATLASRKPSLLPQS